MRLILAAAAFLLAWSAARAEPAPEVMRYVINRDGDQIGTYRLELKRSGPETAVSFDTHVQVKIAFVTVYRFEQKGSERWVDGKLVALETTTDDNGTPHKVSVTRKGNALAVEADGKTTQIDGSMLPFSLWNASLVKQSSALDTQKGETMKIKVTDGGMDNVTVLGKHTKAHHYTIKSSFSQEVWYDDKGNLVQALMVASDGSKISHHLLPAQAAAQ